MRRLAACLALPTLLMIAAACSGLGQTPDPTQLEADLAVERLRVARAMLDHPPMTDLPPFLSTYDPAVGEPIPGIARPNTVAMETTRGVRAEVQAHVGPVPVPVVELRYGRTKHRYSRGDLDSLEGTVLKEVFVHLGPDHCDAVADWLVETYGKPRFHADWDGITQTLSFQWFQAPGDDSRSCYLWWTHWPADKNSMAVYQGDAPKQPRPERIPDEQRAQFLPAWTAAVNRLLRGASPEKAASLSGLEGPLAERLQADLNDLVAHEQAPPTH